MSTPGVSLFQGADIAVNRSNELADEKEEFEDAKRRHAELEQELDEWNYHDSDAEETMDSISNQEPHHGGEMQNEAFDRAQLLAVMESQSNELSTIKELLKATKHSRDQLQKQLNITKAELDRALANKTNTHELLVESKQKISNLESVLERMQEEKRNVDKENNTLLRELEIAKSHISELEFKYDAVATDKQKRDENNCEFNRLQDKHRAEVDKMQHQCQLLSNKLDEKTKQLEQMKVRYDALQNSQNEFLLQKTATINSLSQALEQSQRNCESLREKQDYSQENIRLQRLVHGQRNEIEDMERTIEELRRNLDKTTADVNVMDDILQQYNQDCDASITIRGGEAGPSFIGNSPNCIVQRIAHLRNELCRALSNVKDKREEVRRQQKQLKECNEEIRRLHDEENRALVQITSLKEVNMRLNNRLKLLEEEFATAPATPSMTTTGSNTTTVLSENATLTDLQARVDEQVRQLTTAKEELECRLATQLDEQRRLEACIANGIVDLEELRQERDAIKQLNDQATKDIESLRLRYAKAIDESDKCKMESKKLKLLLDDAQSECKRLKHLNTEMSDAKKKLNIEIEQLRSNNDIVNELKQQQELVNNLKKKLDLSELKTSELENLLETERRGHELKLLELQQQQQKQQEEEAQLHYSPSNAEKNTMLNNCRKCMDHQAQVTQLEIEVIRLSNIYLQCKQDLEQLRQRFVESQHQGEELAARLALGEKQEVLIHELKMKAHQFEEYIRNHEQEQAQRERHHASNSSSGCSDIATTSRSPPSNAAPEGRTNGATVSPRPQPPQPSQSNSDKVTTHQEENEMISIKTAREWQRNAEARIRDEMANIFAKDLKSYQMRQDNLEQKLGHLQHEYDQRLREIELLKQAILAERAKIIQILREKENQCRAILKEQMLTIAKTQDELTERTRRCNEIQTEMKERQIQIEEERQSMKNAMTKMEQQRQEVELVELHWRQRMEDMKKEYDETVKSYRLKYNEAMNNNVHYQRYMADKEEFMYKEYARLEREYDADVAHLKEIVAKSKNKKGKSVVSSTTSSAVPAIQPVIAVNTIEE